jgi:hypothetical protein
VPGCGGCGFTSSLAGWVGQLCHVSVNSIASVDEGFDGFRALGGLDKALDGARLVTRWKRAIQSPSVLRETPIGSSRGAAAAKAALIHVAVFVIHFMLREG